MTSHHVRVSRRVPPTTRAGKMKPATRSASMGALSLVMPLAATVHALPVEKEPAVNKVSFRMFIYFVS